MAKFRQIHAKIWDDPDFQEYTPEGKLVFIYLCSNKLTSESGIYCITYKSIANDTGLKPDAVGKIIGTIKNVNYDPNSHYVYVRRFRRYNPGGRQDLVAKAIAGEFKLSSETPLWNQFIKDYPEFEEAITGTGLQLSLLPHTPVTPNGISKGNGNGTASGNGKDGLSNPSVNVGEELANGSPTVSKDKDAKDEKALKQKYGVGKNVLLTEDELQKLVTRFGGLEQAKAKIDALSCYIGSKGDKYKSHYMTILDWENRDNKKHNGGSNGAHQANTDISGNKIYTKPPNDDLPL